MTKTWKPKTAAEWDIEIAEQQKRLRAMKTDLAKGTDEVTAAHAHGFLTAGDMGMPQVVR